uniref:glycosyltransferase family 4 protein n=1 Tax=Lachnoclostridium phocaeense TaxID=1871021 RepID=UPI0026DCD755|nr:glycosyltransferase family 4 protein [Lachnoclostridium phocaeense]
MRKKKNICIISAQFLPHLGGVERYTYNLGKKLVEKGHAVTVIAQNVDKTLLYEEMDGIKVYRLPCFAAMDGRLPIPKLNADARKIHSIISCQNYDLLIINTRFYPLSLYGVWLGYKKKVPTIVIEHGTGHIPMTNKYIDFLGKVYEHSITAMEKRFSPEFYGVSQASLEWLKHFHINGKGILYNAMDMNGLTSLLEKENAHSYREKLGIPQNAILVTFTGRLLKEKGVFPLAKAVLELPADNVYLAIAGDGEEKARLEKIATKKICLLGSISHAEVIALLKETDIFCLPTVYPEGLPTSVLEAAACHNYIITTKYGGAKELIVDDSYGMVLENNSVSLLKKALNDAIGEPETRKNASELTYSRLLEKFTWDKVADKVLEL